jgi:hypothetical protein
VGRCTSRSLPDQSRPDQHPARLPRAPDADVDLDEVEQFLTGLGLWASRT